MTDTASSEPSADPAAQPPADSRACRPVVTVRALPSYARLGPVRDDRLAGLVAAQRDAVERSRARVVVHGRAVSFCAPLLDSRAVRDAIARAMAEGLPEVRLYAPGTDLEMMPPLARYDAAQRGGLWMDVAGTIEVLNPLLDEVARSFAARTGTVRVGTGTAPAGEMRFGDLDDRLLVIALDGPVVVTSRPDPAGPEVDETVESSAGLLTRRLRSLRAADDGAWILIGFRVFDAAEAWRLAAAKAGWWPVLRLDIPHDLTAPAEVYGHDEPLDPIRFLGEEVDRLLADGTLAEARAQWHAELASPGIPPGSLVAVTTPLEQWGAIRVEGRLLGLPAQPTATDPAGDAGGELVTFAAGGWELTVHEHATPMLETLAAGQTTPVEEIRVDCPLEDPWCAHRFARYMVVFGLLAALPSDPGSIDHHGAPT